MKNLLQAWAVLWGALLMMLASAQSAELGSLKVLYVGDGAPRRVAAFQAFLKPNVATVDAVSLSKFKPESASNYDVVLLDWHQSEDAIKVKPLGKREAWIKPTVLLGSAGLNLAKVWEVKGGFG